MEARNRDLNDWYGKIRRAEIRLPRFQRQEAWDRGRICSLLETVIQNLPLGITLILEVGEEEQFVSRHLATAPELDARVYEHLLDGQQRLTALWRALHNNYENETYFIYSKALVRNEDGADLEDMSAFWRARYFKKDGRRYPLWCDDPAQTLARGLIPFDLLRPEDVQVEIDEWVERATAPLEPVDADRDALRRHFEFQRQVSDTIKDLRATLANYNLPYLSLPSQTDKSVALDVFINMNTNSKPLSTYDIIVAEVESALGQSLHDLESALVEQHPEVARYSALPNLILNTSALMQGELPSQRGAWQMNKRRMVEQWPALERGLVRMAAFLAGEGVFDADRLPTNAVLAVIAALYSEIPDAGDKRGQDEVLLRSYLWHAFFCDRYENSAATHAFSDYRALKNVVLRQKKPDGSEFGRQDVPIFAEHALADAEELLSAEWPKRMSIRGRGILAVSSRIGALDFSTGERLGAQNIGHRHYHHIFPDALLKEADIPSFLALNCALITDKTNISIGRKDPLDYLKDRYEWTSEEIVLERLRSHLIPLEELANGGYEGLDDAAKAEKLKKDFDAFLMARAELVLKAVELLVDGRQLSIASVFSAEQRDQPVHVAAGS